MNRKAAFMFVMVIMTLHALSAVAQLVEGQTYRIVPVMATGKSLFVKNASKAAKTDVLLWAETDVPAQQWRLGAAGSNFTLRNVYTGGYLGLTSNARGGTTCQVSSVSGGRWKLEAVDEAAGIYHIKFISGNNQLELTSTDDGSVPTLAAATDDKAQQWKFVAVKEKSDFTTAMRKESMDKFISIFVRDHGSARSFGNGGWGNAEMLEVGLDAYESSGLQKYLDLCRSDYSWFHQHVGDNWNGGGSGGYDWFGYDFNDDVMWEIIAVARLAWITGESQYLDAARHNFDLIYERAYMPQWNMMRWAENSGDRFGTNSCIMGPTEVAACYLGLAGAGEEYFEKARALYAKHRERLANMSTGQVYDSFVIDPATGGIARDNEGQERFNRWASTYNQGTMLGAAVLLYNHYGTEQYRRDADKIVDYTVKHLCNSDGIISVCQVNDGDLCGFKGILMRYVRRYVLDLCKPKRAAWLMDNAFLAYNNRNARGLTSSAWLTKSTNADAKNAFSCSTAVSAAVNCVFTDVEKDAYSELTAPQVDYHGGAFAVETGERSVLSLKNGTWVVFDNVDFGSGTAQSVAVTLGKFATTGTATVDVYLDSMTGNPVATLTATKDDANSMVFAAMQPVTGSHHVYLRFGFSNPTRSNAFQVASLMFSPQTVDELATGIESAEDGGHTQDSANVNRKVSDRNSFDMLGRSTAITKPGLHIVNGKKHLLR